MWESAIAIVKTSMWTLLGIILSAIFGFFQNNLAVQAVSLVKQGTIGGVWYVTMKEYDRNDPNSPKLVLLQTTAELEQLGSRVVGKMKATPGREWNDSGCFNGESLALAEISATPGSGLGTYMLHQGSEGPIVFMGYWTGRECKPQKDAPSVSLLMKCPVIFVESDHPELKSEYSNFVDSQPCETLSAEMSASKLK